MFALLFFGGTCGTLTAALTEWSVLSTGVWWVLTIILAICALMAWIRSPNENRDGIAVVSALSLILYSVIIGGFSVFNLATGYWVAGALGGGVMLVISGRMAPPPQPDRRSARA